LTTFFGYTTDGPAFTSLTLTASQTGGNHWPTADNFYVGASSVPEPSSALLLLCGGGLLAFLRRRR